MTYCIFHTSLLLSVVKVALGAIWYTRHVSSAPLWKPVAIDAKVGIVSPQVHDAYLQGYLHATDGSLHLFLRTYDGSQYTLVVPRTTDLYVSHPQSVSIIFDITPLSLEPDEQRRYLWQSIQETGPHIEDFRYAAGLGRSSRALVISMSYGPPWFIVGNWDLAHLSYADGWRLPKEDR